MALLVPMGRMKAVGHAIRRRPDRLSEDKCSEIDIDWPVVGPGTQPRDRFRLSKGAIRTPPLILSGTKPLSAVLQRLAHSGGADGRWERLGMGRFRHEGPFADDVAVGCHRFWGAAAVVRDGGSGTLGRPGCGFPVPREGLGNEPVVVVGNVPVEREDPPLTKKNDDAER
ncbi:hypothetical protein CGRA01v4_14776 [Colletotrichum graminicola]|uniref:Uncharacterized protein n=1 Tax=Colletotrichum graminicola (strain M1.001 / M2 / FGSC 10212) TaxID=645133 RepID=E3QF77_COLGM|nr:uncharacterized protein GLRG_04659 [Colletotrichum graminicola M1.001]EFQ29515.1 hypothetical protein GLRG_04659 [Colletotrichum graminicola M1.001]WDK23484.1 hypothetical protein CGRA01v4_14776 [Colletotrichum graminicola]